MTPNPTKAALFECALSAIEQLLAHAHEDGDVPFYGPTELGALPVEEQEARRLAEQKCYRERPEQSALHFCLLAASALLEVSQSLASRPVDPSPQELEREWKDLAAHTKVAGRSAYRAALILADPTMSAPGSATVLRATAT